MADTGTPAPGPFSGSLDDPDPSLLREHFRDVTRWVIGDAAGGRLTAGQSDALAEEIAVVLASGLVPALRREIEHQAEKTIAGLQSGPVSFGHDHQLLVAGLPVPDLVKLYRRGRQSGRLRCRGSNQRTPRHPPADALQRARLLARETRSV